MMTLPVTNNMATNNNETIQLNTNITPTPVTPDIFKNAFRLHPAGVAVITGQSESGPMAMTISSLASVSADPPIVMFSLSTQSFATKGLLEAPTVVLHMMNSEQKDLAHLGATGGAERFTDKNIWEYLPTGEPTYKYCRGKLRCKILHRVEAGTGIVCVALAIDAESHGDGENERPLVYFARQWHELNSGSAIN